MSSVHPTKCSDCKHEFQLVIGGTMRSCRRLCLRCGDSKYTPRHAPKPEDLDFKDMDFTNPEIMNKYLNNPDLWPLYGRYFTKEEHNLISEILSRCDCGGALLREPNDVKVLKIKDYGLYRCPKCFSNDLIVGESTLLCD